MKLNTAEVAELRPDYLGFIFWEKSSRFFEGEIPPLASSIKKIGVFVDAALEEVLEKIEKYGLQVVQLHGNESLEFCQELRIKLSSSHRKGSAAKVRSREPHRYASANRIGSSPSPRPTSTDHVRSSAAETSDDRSAALKSTKIEIIKVFSIKNDFDFRILKPYEPVCDYFLFDTKGELPGGNGYAFDWKVLEGYSSTTPYFLSGGIGLDEVESIKKFAKLANAKHCHAIDVNSRFEIEPGLKKLAELKKFKNALNL